VVVIGIDPGLEGAVVALRDGRVHAWTDTPTMLVTMSRTKRRRYDVAAMSRWLRQFGELAGHRCLAVIEVAGTMPREGVSSALTIGYGAGCWHGILTTHGIPYEAVHPRKWKLALSLGKDKNFARLRAEQLFPEAADLFALKGKGAGRAEAALLAEYGVRMLSGTLVPALPTGRPKRAATAVHTLNTP
jgi:crossover junction endodeoxyribonuclease RuvC